MEHVGHDRGSAVLDGSGLKIAVSTTGPTREITIIRIDGAIDTMTAGDLEQVISSLTARGHYRLVVDLAGVEYISSAGWGVFVSHLREIRERAGDIKLARMTPDVREIYELLEFDGLLPFFDELDGAVAAFQGADNRHGAGTATAQLPVEQPPTAAAPDDGRRQGPHSSPTLDEAVLQSVAEDPFQTIGEIRHQVLENHSGRLPSSWWKVFGSLRRQHMLTRRARFRYCRRMRKTFR